MEPIEHNEDLKKIILDMTQKEFQGSTSNKGALRYIEGKINSVIDESISEFHDEDLNVQTYIKTLKRGAYKQNISEIAKIIKGEEIFKSKAELIKFARYLGMNVNAKQSYKILLKKVSTNIYENKDYYNKKYIYYTKKNSTYILEPEKIKNYLIENYKSRARNDMKSIAKILNIDTKEEEGAEDIRKKVINCIIKDKLSKIKN
ncbi:MULTISPECIES: hypothetical protein [Paraclostridium]|uniref:hypothetical protein n=1 Tax=Paraclostridium TaxID=1849822 RepID=UPI001CC7981A|nr:MULTISPECIES: hypothetical protein [Paraclostridium]MBZ6005214.1 hypothetical protein [Paraclostridium bifermentans]MCR1875364.1 hypothetical protein [Paraclostridium bifermentans]MDU0296851.1 hypothetical protein [Paraclostridium sp. MRS3W1]